MKQIKKIGLCVPTKDEEKGVLRRGLLNKDSVDELIALLEADASFELTKGIDLRTARIENGNVYSDTERLSDLDGIFWYYLPPYLPEHFEFQVLKTLSQKTKILPSPDGLLKSIDKFSAHTILRNAGLPTPDFALFRSDDFGYVRTLFKKWGPLLLKPRLGRFGHGIVKVESEGMLRDAVGYVASNYPEPISIFVEKFEANKPENWISVTTINKKPLFGYRKNPSKFVDGWKVYDEGFKGGEAFYVDPGPVADIASRAAHALGADVVGFDCIYGDEKKQYLIVDENTFPGIYEECFLEAQRGSLAQNFYQLICEKLKAADSELFSA